jgi:enoyl-CoA hydratase
VYRTIVVEQAAEGFATLTLNRPERLNALSVELRSELAAAVDVLEADPEARVLILTGAGQVFTAGLALTEWESAGSVAAGAYELDVVAILGRFSSPVIGAINAPAITGGLEIAVACDILIASTLARFADTRAQVGLLPGWGGSVRLARRVGLSRAKELAFTGRYLSAQEAEAWGLVNHVVEPQELLPSAHALARWMLSADGATLRAYKRLLDDECDRSFRDALERARSIALNSTVTKAEIYARLAAMRSPGNLRNR